ncbi:hypothetical protein SKAU_G00274490 [Synaphobranchus kaupii]|uniref:Uncharacterized protein n=1 Tax=Synaphobranchus kaupii TaxID=118154 RepID=A0A9Q1F160_SYNKA|nr:hypothetical protein SKAU_G00274490 [Synaphobranchus kaupii]
MLEDDLKLSSDEEDSEQATEKTKLRNIPLKCPHISSSQSVSKAGALCSCYRPPSFQPFDIDIDVTQAPLSSAPHRPPGSAPDPPLPGYLVLTCSGGSRPRV